MSRENVELVKRIYDQGLLDGEPARLLDLMGPDVEYVNPQEAVDPGTRRGREEVAKALTALGDFDWTTNHLHELFDAGDSVVAWVTFRARSRGSEYELSQDEDLPAALEAVGLTR
jgi:ketosteroid isomerase-like protein